MKLIVVIVLLVFIEACICGHTRRRFRWGRKKHSKNSSSKKSKHKHRHRGHSSSSSEELCDRLFAPQNGNFELSGRSLEALAVFSCDEGFVLTGDQIRRCKETTRGNMKWSGADVTCEPVALCNALDAPENGSLVINERIEGALACYACDSGFVLTGDQYRVCLEGSGSLEWNGTEATCELVDCGIPTGSNGLNISYDGTTLGSIANFSCSAGNALLEGDPITCLPSGEWSSGAASCCAIRDYIYYMPMDAQRDDILEGECPNGRIYNNAILVDGRVDQGIYFDGIDQWVDLGNHRHECFGDLQLCPDGYTLSMWLYIGPKVANEMYYISSGGQTGSSFGVMLSWLSGDLSSWFSTRDEIWKVSHPGVKEQWQHIVLTWKQDEGLSIWINCTNEVTDFVSETRNQQTTQWNNVVLGRPNNAFNFYGEAIIDELIFWDKKLPDDRIEDLCVAYDADPYSTLSCPTILPFVL